MGRTAYEKPIFYVESLFDKAHLNAKGEKAWLSCGCCEPEKVIR